jgi:hypothetical protein
MCSVLYDKPHTPLFGQIPHFAGSSILVIAA